MCLSPQLTIANLRRQMPGISGQCDKAFPSTPHPGLRVSKGASYGLHTRSMVVHWTIAKNLDDRLRRKGTSSRDLWSWIFLNE